MKVLIVGKGGREHALSKIVKKSSLVTEVFIAPGNIGMKDIGTLVNVHEEDILNLVNFAEENKIDLTIVGPESSLSLGIVNEFEKRGLKIFGPTKESAMIETSKEYAKYIMGKYNIPTGKYRSFTEKEEAIKYLENQLLPIVIKEDGLKAGKGVTVAFSVEEAKEAVKKAFEIHENKIIIEEYLDGFEFSIIAIANENKIIPLEIAQDHKRIYDGDLGPNTGGMGVYSPVEKITKEVIDETVNKIMKPMLDGLIKEGTPFKGFLFGGIMLTKEGVKTIEFNARFGDPEAQGILPRLKSDFVKVILDILDKKETKLIWDKRKSLAVVMASSGYPDKYSIGEVVNIDGNIDGELYFMGVKEENKNIVTNGGRVLSLVCFGDTLEKAREKTYEEIKKINFKKMFFRNDIGLKMCYNSKNK
ncbi:phosphoribosylamine--glycine ligase [uncultured Cetobacterium sp.]|uniref:phosphoribosylamine--glycine ligase n=1 Tax=uncultured Cetobacterium sp. TaxID=527638 RepID=UPI002630F27E|nr:phosphoribosylamine--glycine ligase [uncultured Cetobacterium sp.]